MKKIIISILLSIAVIIPLAKSGNVKANSRELTEKELQTVVDDNRGAVKDGKVASYIPALKEANSDDIGISIYNLKTKKYINSGKTDKRFAIESISKLPVLLLAMKERGMNAVFEKVNTEPTGFPFNSVLDIEIKKEKTPMNPFVNVGAITTTSLIKGNDKDKQFKSILSFIRTICNDDKIMLNDGIWKSEAKTGDNNRSIGYLLKNNNMISGDVNDILETYFKQCSVMVNAKDLANMGAVLANDGVAPWNDKRIISKEFSTKAKSIMLTAGLYDESGEFSAKAGIPTKSGVGGGLVSSIPRKYGIGFFGPSLNNFGNSIAGVSILTQLSKDNNLSIFQ